jgi:predicted nucleotidyltransferase
MKKIRKRKMNPQQMALDNLILKFRTGSNMYGTTTPESDEDFMGVCMPNKEYVLGTYRFAQAILSTKPSNVKRANTKEDIDYTVYSLPKFIHLISDGNPNVFETLFAHENCLLFRNNLGKRLLDNRELFLSLKLHHSFSGYSYSQRQKMIYHEKNNKTGHRLERMKELGYEPKFASHMIRLLKFGIQLLKEHTLTLPSPANNLIRDIKLGKFTLVEIFEMADELQATLDRVYETSTLPTAPDYQKISDLQIDMLEDFWYKGELH